MLTSKSVDLIIIFMQELFSLFCRVALNFLVPFGKQSKEPPIWKAPWYLNCNKMKVTSIIKKVKGYSIVRKHLY